MLQAQGQNATVFLFNCSVVFVTAGAPVETPATYWSISKWGVIGRPSAEVPKRSKHYQRPPMPLPTPDAEVFHTLNGGLEFLFLSVMLIVC